MRHAPVCELQDQGWYERGDLRPEVFLCLSRSAPRRPPAYDELRLGNTARARGGRPPCHDSADNCIGVVPLNLSPRNCHSTTNQFGTATDRREGLT